MLHIDLRRTRPETGTDLREWCLRLYPAIQIGQMIFPTFGIALAIGFIAAAFFAIARARRYGIARATTLGAALVGLASAEVGARLAGFLLFVSVRWANPSVELSLGLALAALAVTTWARMRRASLAALADCFAQPLALALILVRFGCFLAGCDFGRPAGAGWGVLFTNLLALAWYRTPLGTRLHPTQLYECCLAALILLFLTQIERRKPAAGVPFLVLVVSYAFGRFFIEFLRGDADRGFLGPLSIPQWFCTLILVVVVTLLTLHSRPRTIQSR